MRIEQHTLLMAAAVLPLFSSAVHSQVPPAPSGSNRPVQVKHYFVPHFSTTPAIEGKLVGLYLREKVQEGDRRIRPVVLMLHGHPVGSSAAFDVAYRDYSWMEALALAGIDAFALDLTGYGLSTAPLLDDPCNASAADQSALLKAIPPCAPHYSFQLTTADSDDADIDATVDYIRQLRRVDKVNLIGWSLGGPRAGMYAARHPDKVDRLLLYSPVYNRAEADRPGGRIPEQGVPLSVRSLAGFSNNWDTQIGCSNQFEPAIRNVITSEIARLDPVARDWGESLFRAPVLNPHWGWNTTSAMQIQAPTLLIRGMLDTQVPETADRDLFSDLAIREKVFARVACASHFMLWETPHIILHRYSIEWLRDGTFAGEHSGTFVVDTQGMVKPE